MLPGEMPTALPPVLEIADLEKRYQALRPLRLQSLRVGPAERVAIVGLDAGGAEVLVNLVTGASVADRGTVRVQGRNNADIANADEWLASLDRFGIVSERAVLLEGATLEQNLVMPFTLQIDPIAPDVADRVAALARDCGLADSADEEVGRQGLQRLAGDTPSELRARVHLARAVALDPVLLVLEHPTIGVPESDRAAYAADIVRVTDARRMAALVLTQDQAFAQLVAHRTLKLNPATGALTPIKRGWFK
jgi:ABC-type transporter Mla maintaining outer membrane lipid asymmetry ATPase subunit MlaF